jgi:hypothetical protein
VQFNSPEKNTFLIVGYPGQQRAKVSELSKFGRPVKFSIFLCFLCKEEKNTKLELKYFTKWARFGCF